jgi:serine phosphatase RsbU (regulator of sigma subunit)
MHASAAGIIDAVVSAVRAHAGPAPQADDMTLVVIKRLRPDIHS